MESTNDPPASHRCNVLAMDGGGVRGLSSLLILQELMRHINATLETKIPGGETRNDVEPHDIFDFVAGTSTGGLIAIMLGKLGMTVEECILAYHDLSKKIFGKKRFRGRIMHGLAPTKYSGTRLERHTQGLIERKSLDVTIPMVAHDNSDKIACAVICREHHEQSQYSDIKEGAVPICSLRCPKQVVCLVSEAARATSAAPTFFPVQKIGNRYFIDGGMEYNNPSHAIFLHYSEYARADEARGLAVSTTPQHGQLDFTQVRFVNLGTGTRSPDAPPRQRDRFATLVPGFIRMTIFLKRTLTEFAVNSEKTAEAMANLAWVSSDGSKINLGYERFSADTGVCYIKMDKYKKLSLINTLTSEYLKSPTTQAKLKKVGQSLAQDYLRRTRPGAATEPAPATEATVDEADTEAPQTPPSQMLQTLEPSIGTQASTDASSEYADGITGDPSTRTTELSTSSTTPTQHKMSNSHISADAPLENSQTMTAPIPVGA